MFVNVVCKLVCDWNGGPLSGLPITDKLANDLVAILM